VLARQLRRCAWASMRQVETPLEVARGLSEELGCTLLLKREDLQPVRKQASLCRSAHYDLPATVIRRANGAQLPA